ncbi:MAG TPA: hypothetical protein V6C89_14105 [Drouetiella sp.]|jgi:hypothetical protein
MQRAARALTLNQGIGFLMRLFALLMLVVSVFPESASCAVRADASLMPAHSCCATSTPSCDTLVISDGCCCKAAPVDRASTPGLIAPSTTPFFAVAALPETPLPTRFYAQSVLSRDSAVSHAPPPKIYIFYRALLI